MRDRQGGAALLVALVLLLILTLSGVAGLSSVGLQERMAGSLGERASHFEAAEAALRAGENSLKGTSLPSFDNSGGHYLYSRSDCRFDSAADAASFYTGCSSVTLSASDFTRRSGETADAIDARYLIEQLDGAGVSRDKSLELGAIEELTLYRITALAGRSGESAPTVILQSTYLR